MEKTSMPIIQHYPTYEKCWWSISTVKVGFDMNVWSILMYHISIPQINFFTSLYLKWLTQYIWKNCPKLQCCIPLHLTHEINCLMAENMPGRWNHGKGNFHRILYIITCTYVINCVVWTDFDVLLCIYVVQNIYPSPSKQIHQTCIAFRLSASR